MNCRWKVLVVKKSEDSDSSWSFFNFHLKDFKLNSSKCIQLLSWSPVVDRNRSIKFVRIEHDLSCYLVVLLDSELNVRVYHQNTLVKWMEWDKPRTESDIEKMLEIVNLCLDSPLANFQATDYIS
ncbi:hypothetical protein PV325_006633 [Microctonus aethiopoides]|nr:hypothetical protein PV325_006633 [Microctonus aethiopoides]KAK0082552.1 hypothetical protein PV326_007119 [Microctonus aethiopoides]